MENGMPHLGLARPLGKFYLGNKFGKKPCGRIPVFYFLIEGLLVGAQGLHRSLERLQSRLVEAGAHMPSIDPGLLRFVTYREYQRAEILAGPARLSVTDDHQLLLMDRFEL
jgi:hypothetical protein